MLAQRALLVAQFLSSPPLRAAASVEPGRDGKAVLNHLTEKAPYKFGPYCEGLLLPGERKSVEPMVAVTAPSRVCQHRPH